MCRIFFKKKLILIFQLVRLVQLKQFCDENSESLNETEWDQVQNIIAILEPFNKYSKKLQSKDVTLSDFFGFWILLRIKLSKANDQLSKQLLVQMDRYHNMLIDNPAMIATVYLDPRYQRGLGSKKSLAVKFLADLYEKIIRLESAEDETAPIETHEKSTDDYEFDDMNEYLDACESVCTIQRSSNAQDPKQTITEILNNFSGEELALSASILDYWESKKNTHPELYKLALVMMAIPPTQTSVERVFSALALVLTSHRTNLGDIILENILLVRLNHELISSSEVELVKEGDTDVRSH